MSNDFFRVPDASVGLRINADPYDRVTYNNGTIDFAVGQTVVDPTTGRAGTILAVDGVTATGVLTIRVTADGSGKFGQSNPLEVASVQHATSASDSITVYYQAMQVAGANDPANHQFVDNKGQAFVRFAEGAPQLDAFGKVQVSEQAILDQYVCSFDVLPMLYHDVTVGGGTIAHEPESKGVVLSCGTASGDKAQRTTHKYHQYQPGISQLIQFTGALGDYGKTGVVRRMGYYDDDNGVFFEMNETTFNLVVRSSSSGSLVETRIPQSQWNGDKGDGTGLSGVLLDPTKVNIYWIDFQWLGAGTVRFGVMADGQRLTLHSQRHANTLPHTYMGSGSLPLRYEQENISAAGSTSEMRIFCAVVATEGEYSPRLQPESASVSKSVTVTTPVAMIGLRSAQTFKTLDNRISLYPRDVSVFNGADKAVVVEVVAGDVQATAGAWAAKGGNSSAEINDTASGFTGGSVMHSVLVGPGQTGQVDMESFRRNCNGLRRKADITAAPMEMMLTARLVEAGTGGTVSVALDWDEVSP